MANIAFLGLGNMGLPMALNLLSAGHQVTGYDLIPSSVAKLVEQGGEAASSAVSAVTGVDVVISMLPAGQHVLSLYLGDDANAEASSNVGILGYLSPKTLIIDCSTIDADTSKNVAKKAEQLNFEFIDAPVSGGTAGAKAGSLTFICGGSIAGFEKAKNILANMGANIFHAGPSGAGQIAKICNNMLLSVLMVATSESLALGIDNGLDPSVLSDIMKVSSGGNWTLEKYNPCPNVMETAPASNDYQGGFMVDLMVKDLGLAQQAALISQSSTPMGALARNLYVSHANKGNGKRDFSSIFEAFNSSKS